MTIDRDRAWETMADADWTWLGQPLEELTHEELVGALIMAGKMYYHMRDLYDEQCEATSRMMNRALDWRIATG